MTVAEIAEQLNYTNAQNFIRFFSKKYRDNARQVQKVVLIVLIGA